MAAVRPDVHGFWEAEGATKTFTHELDPALLQAYVSHGARILDYGCGYGRLTARLTEAGYARVVGVDPSRAMIERGLGEHPGLELVHQVELPLRERDGTFDAALLFAVLTCMPDDAAQHATVAELARVLRPGGVLYVSEVPIQRDARNAERYDAYDRGPGSGPHGTFTTPDGGLFRHHTPEHLRALLDDHGFTVTEERPGTAPTLHGFRAENLQLVAHRRVAA
ncbi:class I SAM-dependent methyltransferase [Streptomyces iconiensis]|uniref:Class I SAM-dependent methyltransferase n=1 Tax=Streptomyces iconiensis TaxID=1384038 RepID=A0ABT6ZWV0_9ACTN|nr:class I SAM-dependent methyltransferase [Streptomyces iconiensis]MDJ1133106.1 class I SAM-dependent methyltransferase [Streptomyces iconiensis]